MPIPSIVAYPVSEFGQYDGTNSADLAAWCEDHHGGSYTVTVDSESGGQLVLAFTDFEHTEYATLAEGDYMEARGVAATPAAQFAGKWRVDA